VTEPLRSTNGDKILWRIADEHLPPGKASAYNQALMDLGATICLARSPKCDDCPVVALCLAKSLGVQETLPVSKPRKTIPHHTVTAAVIRQDREVLIAQRPQESLLGGLWEFPGGKQENGENLVSCLKREILEELALNIRVGKKLGVYEHAFTHFRITLHAFCCRLDSFTPELKEHTDICWAAPADLKDYPMGKVDRQIANQLLVDFSSEIF
jgi:A/G-specific adenine glycosylase